MELYDVLALKNNNRINNLEYLVKKAEVKNWKDIQDIVRAGLASKMFSVGDQFVAAYNGVETVWDIIGIDHDNPTDGAFAHSLTIQAQNCIMNCQFDAPEPTNPDTNRQTYGNNRYIHSAIRQWLNSNDASFSWVSQHEYDAAPSGAPYDGAGFLYNLDSELSAVIGTVNKEVAKATVDGGGQDIISDKVFLLSRVEVYGGTEGLTTGELVYPFYQALAAAETTGELEGRIKYLNGAARFWWLRSPYVGGSYLTRYVDTTGGIYYSHSYFAFGLSPACCII